MTSKSDMDRPEVFIVCECDHCSGKIRFPERGIGQQITCPHCGHLTLLRAASSEPSPPPIPASATQRLPFSTQPEAEKRIRCPYCAEWVLPQAIKCRFCGGKLVPQRPSQSLPQNTLPPRPAKQSQGGSRKFGLLLAGCGIGFPLLILLLVSAIKEGSATNEPVITQKRRVSSSEFGGRWPLTVREGEVYSLRLAPVGNLRRVAAIFESGEVKYGLNGTAITFGYRDINQIRVGKKIVGLVPEDTVYNYMDIDFLIRLALENENDLSASLTTPKTTLPTHHGDGYGRPTDQDLRRGAEWLLEQDRKRGR